MMYTEVIKGKRSVAYFDILGFREKVKNLTIDELAELYSKLIFNTQKKFFLDYNFQIQRAETFKRFIFSDSIFLLAYEDTEQGFIDLFTYAWRMMQIALAMDFPMRGAITYGDIYAEQSRGIFIGDSIVNAAIWESKQDWMGAVVDKTAIERYHSIFEGDDLFPQIYRTLLPTYPVPLKDGSVDIQNVINWRLNIISQQGIKALFQYDANDEAVDRKIQNTLTFAKTIREQQLAYFNSDLVHYPYTYLFIGDHKPNLSVPNENGDEY